jgi:hypothetical protein
MREIDSVRLQADLLRNIGSVRLQADLLPVRLKPDTTGS